MRILRLMKYNLQKIVKNQKVGKGELAKYYL